MRPTTCAVLEIQYNDGDEKKNILSLWRHTTITWSGFEKISLKNILQKAKQKRSSLRIYCEGKFKLFIYILSGNTL